jgi:hypothetical protein
LPMIEAGLRVEQKRLGEEQVRLQDELAATKGKLGKLRADQTITDHGLAELRKTTEASATETKLELSRAVIMRDVPPAAALALRNFAAEAIAAGGMLRFPKVKGAA